MTEPVAGEVVETERVEAEATAVGMAQEEAVEPAATMALAAVLVEMAEPVETVRAVVAHLVGTVQDPAQMTAGRADTVPQMVTAEPRKRGATGRTRAAPMMRVQAAATPNPGDTVREQPKRARSEVPVLTAEPVTPAQADHLKPVMTVPEGAPDRRM
jgi:hypothetical protein